MLLQYPLGWLSDRTDRRIVIILASFCAAVCAIFLSGSPTLIAIIFFSGFTFPLYALCISRANDEIGEKSLLSTAGSILLLFGLGAIPGPFIAGWAMQWFSAGGLFFYIIACLLFFILFTAYHLLTRPPAIIRAKKSHQTCRRRAKRPRMSPTAWIRAATKRPRNNAAGQIFTTAALRG